MDDMARLQAAEGAEFEKLLLQLLGEKDMRAVQMAQLARTRSHRRELVKFCEVLIEDRIEGHSQMAAWLKDWF